MSAAGSAAAAVAARDLTRRFGDFTAVDALTLEDLRGFSPVIDEDVFDALSLEGSVGARRHFGGTAPERVRDAVAAARARLAGSGTPEPGALPG